MVKSLVDCEIPLHKSADFSEFLCQSRFEREKERGVIGPWKNLTKVGEIFKTFMVHDS